MFRPYLDVLRIPGAARFSAAGLVARLQMSMISVGAVLFLNAERGSYAVGGTAAALYALSGAVVTPQLSRLIDARGQHRVVPVLLALHVPAIAAFVVLAMTGAADWTLYVLAFVAGSAQPNAGPMVRARWSLLLSGTPRLRASFAWESVLDEVVFITGPPLATVLALQVFPSAAVVVATALLTVGAIWLISQRRTEPPASGASLRARQRPALLLPGVLAVTVVYVLVGSVFGAWEISTVAFAAQQGHRGLAGVMLALYSAGSLVGGLIFGALALRASMVRQFLTVLVLFGVLTLAMPFVTSLWQLGAVALVAGVAVAPVLISGVALVEQIVPAERLTEAMSWATAGLAVGLAWSSPLAGTIVDSHPASVSYWICAGAALGSALIGLAQAGPMRRALAARPGPMVTLAGSEPPVVPVAGDGAVTPTGSATPAAAPAARC